MYLGIVPMLGPRVIGDGEPGSPSLMLPRALPLPIKAPNNPLPMPGPAPIANPGLIVRGPLTYNPPPAPGQPANPPPTPTAAPNTGTPVPAGFPTNQIFVNSDGSFWEFSPSQNQWMNVGTPYGTGASATPPALPPSSGGSNTTPPVTVAPAPAAASSTPIVTGTSYQDILDWLNEDTLLSGLGFPGVPNWITTAGVALLIYKVSNKQGRR